MFTLNKLNNTKLVLDFNKKPISPDPQNLFKLFRSFIQTNLYTSNRYFDLHPYWYCNFFKKSKGNIVFYNILKTFTRFKVFYLLMFNLFFYRINLVIFGNIFLKNEVNSLNFNLNYMLKSVWRLINPFIFIKPNRISNSGWLVFSRLRFYNLNIALILDVFYHKHTIYYLKSNDFYSIGLIPINYNPRLVNFPIPTTSDSFFNQLFFIQLITKLRKSTEQINFNTYTRLWDEI